MKRLARHDLTRPDGRRALVYGSLQGGFADAAESPEDVTGIHLRRDVLTSGWVAITPARNQRPLDGSPGADEDEMCPLCPNGKEIPFPYDAAVFENRFPSFTQDPPPAPLLEGATEVARGRCEMVLYTQRHDASFAGLSALELTRVIAVWTDRTRELWADPAHEYVLTFENRGAEAGATLTHPHGQIYALGHVPPLVDARISAHHAYREENGDCLGCVVARRDGDSSRVVSENASFVVSVPFAARWPYEVAVHVRRHGVGRLADLEPREQRDLAHALRDVARVDKAGGLGSAAGDGDERCKGARNCELSPHGRRAFR